MRVKEAPVLIVAGGLAVMAAGSTLLTPLYGVYRRAFGFSELTLTLVYSVYVIGNLVALVFLGRLSDQIGRRWATLPAMAVAATSSAVYLAASSTGWLFAGRALSGLAIGVALGTATAWLAELDRGGGQARASAVAAIGNLVGIALGPLVAGPLAQYAPAPLRLSHGSRRAAPWWRRCS
jgi:MFS family permease